jgi:hypothetical protein
MAGLVTLRRPWLQLVPAAPKATLARPPAMASFFEQFRGFLAHHTGLNRPVAVKTLLPG